MNRFSSILIGLFGLSVVIIIHEFGHFFACKWFGIATPRFSIGFGPPLFAYRIGSTIFQIALLPFGGFVAINEQQLDLQPYYVKAIVILAGVVINVLFAWLIFSFFRWRGINIQEMIIDATARSTKGVMGPIGIIGLISYSASLSFDHFLLVLGALSMSIGMFNLLPLPFLDGGQLLWNTIEVFTGPLPDSTYNLITGIFLFLFILFLLYISARDIRNRSKPH